MKNIPQNNQHGFAMFVAVMVLSLGTSFAFLAYQVSTTELNISRYSENEAAVQYLAESGVEKVVSWATEPAHSPDPDFFRNLITSPCTQDLKNPEDLPDFPRPAHWEISPFSDFQTYLTDPDTGPFSELKDIGKIVDIQLYAPSHVNGICTVEVTAETGSGASATVRVNIAANPLGNITAGIQGLGEGGADLPVWVHWGSIRYTGRANLGDSIHLVPQNTGMVPNGDPYTLIDLSANFDPVMTLDVENEITSPLPDDGDTYLDRPNVTQNRGAAAQLDPFDFTRLRTFIKKNGAYYTVSDDGQHLLKNGQHILDDAGNHIDSFDGVFDGATDKEHLVWIENAGAPELDITGGRFRGYFYFSGDINIEGDVVGRPVSAVSPPVTGYPDGRGIHLSDINLEGLFVTKGVVNLQRRFSAYGAFYSVGGFTGAGTDELEVWYNHNFKNGVYHGVRTVTPLTGTWRIVPLDE